MRWLIAATVLVASSAQADVVRLDVKEQHDWAVAQTFDVGTYEYLAGTARYEIDPTSPAARDIADIALAPRNARGQVEYHGPFLIMRPKDAARTNGTAIVEVPNRGGDQTNRLLFFADRFDIAAPAKTTEVAHGMGAAMAIEDAMILARSFEVEGAIGPTFARSEATRIQGTLTHARDPDRYQHAASPAADPSMLGYEPMTDAI